MKSKRKTGKKAEKIIFFLAVLQSKVKIEKINKDTLDDLTFS